MNSEQKISGLDFKSLEPHSSSIWMLFVIHPMRRIVGPILVNHTRFTPIQYSLFNLFASTLAFFLFLSGNTGTMILAGILSQLGFFADAMDGAVAKFKRTGSPKGILMDSLVDVARTVLLPLGLCLGLVNSNQADNSLFLWGFAFVAITLAEARIAPSLREAKRFYGNQQDLFLLGKLDQWMLRLYKHFNKIHLRVVFYGFNEREAFAFLIAPIFGFSSTALQWAVSLAVPFLLLRILLDFALMKQSMSKVDEI